jgi:N-formylglutamate deformylase
MPHASGAVPDDVLEAMLGPAEQLEISRRRLLRHIFAEGDPYTDEIFAIQGVHLLPAEVSRFVVDLNRRRHDKSENGIVKLVDFSGQPLYPDGFGLSDEEREQRLSRYWEPYHRRIERLLEEQPVRLLVDGHSMTAWGPSLGPDQGRARPALTLMTGGDSNGEPKRGEHSSVPPKQARKLRKLAELHFARVLRLEPSLGGKVALNEPWSEDELAQEYSDPSRARPVPGFGLEVNRALYLKETDGTESRIPGRIESLNQAFSAFLDDALELFDPDPREVHK